MKKYEEINDGIEGADEKAARRKGLYNYGYRLLSDCLRIYDERNPLDAITPEELVDSVAFVVDRMIKKGIADHCKKHRCELCNDADENI